MKKRFDGKVYLLGNDVNAEQLYPHRYLHLMDTAEMAKHILEGYEGAPFPRIEKGSIIVAGKNFGCGPSRPQAAIAFKGAGVTCIIASSFARSFYRNAINQGIPLIECQQAHEKITKDEIISIDFEKGELCCKKGILTFAIFPEVIIKILSSGGLIPHIRKSLGK